MATPLSRKLGLKPNSRVQLVESPDGIESLLEPLPEQCVLERFVAHDDNASALTLCLLFAPDRDSFLAVFEQVFQHIVAQTTLWLCWPKKSGPMASDLSFDIIQQAALSRGLVDNKICSIDATWSALRCTVRKELRDTWDPADH